MNVKLKFAIALFSVLTLSACNEKSSTNSVFMDNVKVFEGFEMKKDYDKKMETSLSEEVKFMDSLEITINSMLQLGDSMGVLRLKKDYYLIQQQYEAKFESLSTQYTTEVNNRLNEYIEQFAKEKKYDIILGSGGQGNVMYVNDNLDVTEELIAFINQKYSK